MRGNYQPELQPIVEELRKFKTKVCAVSTVTESQEDPTDDYAVPTYHIAPNYAFHGAIMLCFPLFWRLINIYFRPIPGQIRLMPLNILFQPLVIRLKSLLVEYQSTIVPRLSNNLLPCYNKASSRSALPHGWRQLYLCVKRTGSSEYVSTTGS